MNLPDWVATVMTLCLLWGGFCALIVGIWTGLCYLTDWWRARETRRIVEQMWRDST